MNMLISLLSQERQGASDLFALTRGGQGRMLTCDVRCTGRVLPSNLQLDLRLITIQLVPSARRQDCIQNLLIPSSAPPSICAEEASETKKEAVPAEHAHFRLLEAAASP